MDVLPNTSSSFVPKQTLITRPEATRSVFGGLVMFIGLVMLFASALLYGGSFLFEKQMIGQRTTLEKSLQIQQKKLDVKTLQDLERLDSRLTSARILLNNHITILPVFDFFANNTLKRVRYKSFSYTFNPQTQKIEIRASGEAMGYEEIALQSDRFVTQGDLKDFMFSDLSETFVPTKKVSFNFTGSLDPRLVSYVNSLNQQSLGTVSQPLQ